MDFIVENYMWFLVGGGLIVMALIGFIAEKTNFGRGNSKEKEKNKKVREEKIETAQVEEPIIEEQPILGADQFNVIPDLNTEEEKESVGTPDPFLTPDINNQDLYAGLDQFTPVGVEENDSLNALNEDLSAPLTSANEMDFNQPIDFNQTVSLDQPLENIAEETTNVENPIDLSESVNETVESPIDLSAPVSEVTEVPEVSEVSEVTEVPEVSEVSEVTEVPEVSEVSEVTEVPEVSEVTEVTEVPEVTESEVVDLEKDELKEQNIQSLNEIEASEEATSNPSDEMWKF